MEEGTRDTGPGRTSRHHRQPGHRQERLELGLTGEMLQARFGRVTLIVQLIKGTSPNWKMLIPGETPQRVRAMAPDLEGAMRRIRKVAEDGSKIVRLTWSGDSMVVSARADEEGEVEATVPVITEGGDGRIAFNVGYLLDYLRGKEGMVEMGVTTVSQPALFRYGKGPLVVMMPMFVQWAGPAPATPEPAPAVQPEPEAEAQSEPTAGAAPEPTAEAEPEPTAEAQPEPEAKAKPRRRGRAKPTGD